MALDKTKTQKAVNDLIRALGIPEQKLSRVEINCSGVVKVFTRDRAYYTAAHVEPFSTKAEEAK